ncbi:hypothetical protein IL38_16365 [Actinopolyspora erythraea]|uniref:Type I restriction modification DNA specificity domain-containing protein n=1 Tax=Actinopolyspora erythraea TaxID=414996 RepID=A0ABR4X1T8_9ACTN|nr:hypothetical protein IL38_16365 [Actinopolyspora erythraea]
MESLGKGATFKEVSKSVVAKISIPLPPLDAQRRIAKVLDQAELLRAKRREAIALLDELAHSIFLDMFGDTETDSTRWPLSTLGQVGYVQGGLQLSGKRKSLPITLPYLRVANVYRNKLDLSELKNIQASETETKRTQLHAGDILIVEGHGDPSEIGRSALWDGSVEPCTHQNHLIRVRLQQDLALPEFVNFYINSEAGRRHLLRAARTTSGLNTISTKTVKETPVAIPPLDEQRQFRERLVAIDALKARHQAHLAELDALFASLQDRAFRGTLWEEEPAAIA